MIEILLILGVAFALDFLLSRKAKKNEYEPTGNNLPLIQEIYEPREVHWPPKDYRERKFRVITNSKESPCFGEIMPFDIGEPLPKEPSFVATEVSFDPVFPGVWNVKYTFRLRAS